MRYLCRIKTNNKLYGREEGKQIEEKATTEVVVAKKRSSRRRTVSKTLEAARRLKGSLIVNDPKFLL